MRPSTLVILVAAGFSSGVALAQSNATAPAPTGEQAAPPNPLADFPAREHRGGGRRLAGLQAACGNDFAALCPGMQPGDGKLRPCLRANRAKLSKSCGDALSALRAARTERAMPTPAPANLQ